jgi:hypothetical protein
MGRLGMLDFETRNLKLGVQRLPDLGEPQGDMPFFSGSKIKAIVCQKPKHLFCHFMRLGRQGSTCYTFDNVFFYLILALRFR